jgi:hypothetical protein
MQQQVFDRKNFQSRQQGGAFRSYAKQIGHRLAQRGNFSVGRSDGHLLARYEPLLCASTAKE